MEGRFSILNRPGLRLHERRRFTSDSTVRSNFYRARKAAGLNPTMRFHDMRDTHASMLIRDGRPITEIAVRLGHTKKDGSPNPATTLAHYAHLSDAATSADETCERLEARAVGLQS